MTQGIANGMVATALERVLQGSGVGREETLALAGRASLQELLEAAGEVRERGKGKTVSFSK